MKITKAFHLRTPRKGVRIIADSHPAIIKLTGKGLLDRGIAILADVKEAQFPWTNNLAYHLNGDETDLKAAHKIVGGTDDPVVVCLARRYWRAVNSGRLRPGSVRIPAREEAQQELEDHESWSKSL